MAERRYGVSANTTLRIPTLEIEAAAVAQIKTVLSSPEAIAAVCQKIAASGTTLDEPQIVLALSRLGDIWERVQSKVRLPDEARGGAKGGRG